MELGASVSNLAAQSACCYVEQVLVDIVPVPNTSNGVAVVTALGANKMPVAALLHSLREPDDIAPVRAIHAHLHWWFGHQPRQPNGERRDSRGYASAQAVAELSSVCALVRLEVIV
jgi:hypothetical protein